MRTRNKETGFTRRLVLPAIIALATIASACDEQSASSDGNSTQPGPEPRIKETNLTPQGAVVTTENGYQSSGDLVMQLDNFTQTFDDGLIDVAFDEIGRLIDFEGKANISGKITEHASIVGSSEMDIKLMTGAEINADEKYGIILKDERRYFVYYASSAVEMNISSPLGEEKVTLNMPQAGGKIILITDPLDPFLYKFASTAIGDWGEGDSKNGLIPFVPAQTFSGLSTFDGKTIEKGKMGLGFKFVDFFEVEGMRVIDQPDLDIDWENPLQSEFSYQAGVNGNASFSLGILGNTFFAFDLAETSGTIDVNREFGSAAFVLDIAPDLEWIPEWMPIDPTTDIYAELYGDSDGKFSMELAGNYRSTKPLADLSGTMKLDNSGTLLSASTLVSGENFDVSLAFANGITTGKVLLPVDYSNSLESEVLATLDTQLSGIDQAYDDLANATENYNFEVSLRGLRASLPATADAVTKTLNAVPDIVYKEAYDIALSKINSSCKTFLVKVCLKDLVDEVFWAKKVATDAKNEASAGIQAPLISMADLKKQALENDDASLRAALKRALKSAYDHRVYKRKIEIKLTIHKTFGSMTLYSKTFSKTVIDPATATKILTAYNNVDQIPVTSDIMVNAADIVRALPVKEIVSQVRDEVAAQLQAIPGIEGLGFQTTETDYEAFVIVGGEHHSLGQINALSPRDVRDAMANLVADILVADKS